jgi:disulfide bond formation protein DsbB
MSPQTLQIYNTFLALLALFSLAAALGLLGFRVWTGSDTTGGLGLGTGILWVAWLVALVATTGSLIYSEVVGFIPCKLCWYQRIAMYPMVAVLLVGALRREPMVKYYALPLSLVGLGISVWHYLVQAFPSIETGACDLANPCSARWVNVFGFVSIPFMAGAGFLLISVLLAFYLGGTRE